MSGRLKKAIKEYYLNGSVEKMADAQSVKVLQENNMIFPSEEIEHDELIVKLFEEKNASDKDAVVKSFIVGLEGGHAEKRAALSAYAIMLNFPKHNFRSTENIQCEICGGFERKTRDFTLCNLARYTVGASNSGNPEQLYFFLKEHNKASVPLVQSVAILSKVLNLLRSANAQDTPTTMEKKLRLIPGLEVTKEQSRGLLDLLGQIGVLESDEHKGFIHKYTYIGCAPKKSRSTDWSYPVDFWKGDYGVNEDAIEFWFGKYLKRFA